MTKDCIKDVHYYYYWYKINTTMKYYCIAPQIAKIIIIKIMAMPSPRGTEQLWSNHGAATEQPHIVLLICKMTPPLWRTVCHFLEKLNIHLPHESFNSQVFTQEECKHNPHKDACSSLTCNISEPETEMSRIKWLGKWIEHMFEMEYHSTIRWNQLLVQGANWVVFRIIRRESK